MPKKPNTKRICSVDGCERRHSAKGLCALHYQRTWHGRPMDGAGMRRSAPKGSSIEDRLWFHTDKSNKKVLSSHVDTPCWLITSKLTHDGCGSINKTPAHRVAWESQSGKIPKGMLVCHRCDVRNCVRPDHLFLGAQSDNMQDMVTKRRGYPGPRKLTKEDVLKIRAETHRSQTDLANLYGVDRKTIHNVLNRKTWKHLP